MVCRKVSDTLQLPGARQDRSGTPSIRRNRAVEHAVDTHAAVSRATPLLPHARACQRRYRCAWPRALPQRQSVRAPTRLCHCVSVWTAGQLASGAAQQQQGGEESDSLITDITASCPQWSHNGNTRSSEWHRTHPGGRILVTAGTGVALRRGPARLHAAPSPSARCRGFDSTTTPKRAHAPVSGGLQRVRRTPGCATAGQPRSSVRVSGATNSAAGGGTTAGLCARSRLQRWWRTSSSAGGCCWYDGVLSA